MLDATMSGCINHPGVEAVGRCKQCAKPFCGTCMVVGPTGKFCSQSCSDRHLQFVQRAQQMEQRTQSGKLGRTLKHLLVKLILFGVVLGGAAWAILYFNVPQAAPIVRQALGFLSGYIPGL